MACDFEDANIFTFAEDWFEAFVGMCWKIDEYWSLDRKKGRVEIIVVRRNVVNYLMVGDLWRTKGVISS